MADNKGILIIAEGLTSTTGELLAWDANWQVTWEKKSAPY